MQDELVCAWCNTKKRNIELVTHGTSHGICPACLLKVFGFTVTQMRQAQTIREEEAKLARAKKRRQRAQEKRTGVHHVR